MSTTASPYTSHPTLPTEAPSTETRSAEAQWVDQVLERARLLRDAGQYEDARAVFGEAECAYAAAISQQGRERLDVGRALAIYKDPDLPVRRKLTDALRLVQVHVSNGVEAETFAVAGAIEKRLYELDTRLEHLEKALHFYQSGHARDRATCWQLRGYPGINAAFLLDMMASIERSSALPSQRETSAQRRILAAQLRLEILDQPPLAAPARADYWLRVTLAEAALGAEQFERAKAELREARALEPAQWMVETTARQLAALSRFRSANGMVSAEARDVLGALLGDSMDAVCSAARGKLGLALSGGGFRASFFHLGVLARLAQLDLLRHVEVISCVSGGSLVGALYALELQHLYQANGDGEISRMHFVELVKRVVNRFTSAVRENLRTRVAFSVRENLAMLSQGRSRSLRIAQLYEDYLYSEVAGQKTAVPRYVHELVIRPKGTSEFRPRHHNWNRKHKVPLVIFNAATLNTGHAWHFTSEMMGEPPARDEDVDVNDRFARQSYSDFPETAGRVRLGHAVAASACVPGLFEPIAIENAYGATRILLVDGGVHDNQGTSALLEQDCTALIVSDGSGQLALDSDPSASAFGAVLRSDAVFQSRMREIQYQDLLSRRDGKLLVTVAFLHLKQGFARRDIRAGGSVGGGQRSGSGNSDLDYKVSRGVQERLAAIRTDLDAFSEVEAEMLMASGYCIAEAFVQPEAFDAPVPAPDGFEQKPITDWYGFLRVLPLMQARQEGTPTERRLLSLLGAGEKVVGKAFMVSGWARTLGTVALLTAAAALALLMWEFRDAPLLHLTVGGAAIWLGTELFRAWKPQLGAVLDAVSPSNVLARAVRNTLLAAFASAAARFQVRWVDSVFLRSGRVQPLLESVEAERLTSGQSR